MNLHGLDICRWDPGRSGIMPLRGLLVTRSYTYLPFSSWRLCEGVARGAKWTAAELGCPVRRWRCGSCFRRRRTCCLDLRRAHSSSRRPPPPMTTAASWRSVCSANAPVLLPQHRTALPLQHSRRSSARCSCVYAPCSQIPAPSFAATAANSSLHLGCSSRHWSAGSSSPR